MIQVHYIYCALYFLLLFQHFQLRPLGMRLYRLGAPDLAFLLEAFLPLSQAGLKVPLALHHCRL